MTKKAQGLSLNTIIIAAVVLIVLLILVGVFTGYFGKFLPSFMAGAEKTCPDEQIKNECNFETEKPVLGNFNPALPEGKVCCLNVDFPKFKSVKAAGEPASFDGI